MALPICNVELLIEELQKATFEVSTSEAPLPDWKFQHLVLSTCGLLAAYLEAVGKRESETEDAQSVRSVSG